MNKHPPVDSQNLAPLTGGGKDITIGSCRPKVLIERLELSAGGYS